MMWRNDIISSVKGLKAVYKIDGAAQSVPEVTEQIDTDFKEQMRLVRKYWQTATTKGRSGKKKARSDGTMRNTELMMASLKNKLGSIELTDAWVEKAAERMLQDKMSNGSINAYMHSVSRFFEALGHPVEVPTYEYDAEEHFYYSVTSVNQLLKGAYARSIPHGAIMAFLYYQGPRNSELCNLKMENLDLVHNEVAIYGQKTHKWRNIPLDPLLMPALNKWLDLRKNEIVPFLKQQGMEVPDNIFLNKFGRPFKDEGIEKLVYNIAKRIGFEGKELTEAHPHTLRHTCCNHLIHVHGWSITDVAYYMGDKVATVEKYYAHTGVNDCRRNMERMRGVH